MTRLTQTYRAVLASKHDRDTMLVFSDLLEEAGALQLARAYRWAAENGKRPQAVGAKEVLWPILDGTEGKQLIDVLNISNFRKRCNCHRAFERLGMALAKVEGEAAKALTGEGGR